VRKKLGVLTVEKLTGQRMSIPMAAKKDIGAATLLGGDRSGVPAEAVHPGRRPSRVADADTEQPLRAEPPPPTNARVSIRCAKTPLNIGR